MNELDVVEINAELIADGHRLLLGTRGVIVHKFNDNHFLVEFDQPKCVVWVYSEYLKLVTKAFSYVFPPSPRSGPMLDYPGRGAGLLPSWPITQEFRETLLAKVNRIAAQRAANALKHYEDTCGLSFVGSPDVAGDVMEEM